MIKALSAVAIAAFVAASLTFLPGFAPQVEASVPQALAKGDRLDVHPSARLLATGLAEFEASCLRAAGSKMVVRRPGWSPPTAPHRAACQSLRSNPMAICRRASQTGV